MKRFFTTMLLFLCLNAAFTQSSQEVLAEQVDIYVEAVQGKDFETMLDYMPPQITDLAPREQMLEALEKQFNDPTIQIRFENMVVHDISEILEVEGGQYALVKYSFEMIMVMQNEATDSEEADGQFMYEIFKATYGEDKTRFDQESNTIFIDVSSSMYAMNFPEKDAWKFIEKKEGQEALFQNMLPEEAWEKLK